MATFRLDYRLNGRRETLPLGRYGRAGLTLALARERVKAEAGIGPPTAEVFEVDFETP